MRVTEQLLRDRKRKEQLRKSGYDDEDQETLTYAQRRKSPSINAAPSTFASKMNEGINTGQNVFDRTAVFRNVSQND